ncbi:MAG: exo-alpha-sialidase, partial [Clostridia bacterium]|nr:exo-alpha-sialidase [Clostridia bacterium]
MLKYAKKIAVVALAMVMLVLTFAACNGAKDTTNDTQTGDTSTAMPTGPVLTADFKIIYEDSSEKIMNRVRTALRDATGKTAQSVKASAASGEYNYAILIGNTGLSESTDFINGLEADNYGVKIIESEGSIKIIIAAKNADHTGLAVDIFMNEYAPKTKGETQLLKTESTVKKYEEDPQVIIDRTYGGIEFEEEIINVTSVSGIPYTRMTKLQDGRLMMVYGQSNQIVALYSSDNGLTWGGRVDVTNSIDQDDRDGKKLLLANAVPYQLADGTILVAYRANEAVNRSNGDDSVKVTGKYHSSIRIMGSTDNGKTWQRHSIVWDLYEENIQKWYTSFGLWEPHLGMLNGELACFFAIGKSVYEYDHIINSTEIFVYRNNEWVRAEYTSDETPGAIKNGMPVWQELSEGGYVMTVE